MLQVLSAAVPAMTSLAFGIYLRATPQRVCQVLADPALVPDFPAGMPAGKGSFCWILRRVGAMPRPAGR